MEAILELFDKISDVLVHLSDLDREKVDAVVRDDLVALDDVLKREQAQSLIVRCLEQKRIELLTKHGLLQVPLDALPKRFPEEMQMQAKNTVERMQTEYRIYRQASQTARDVLECNLHEIEKILIQAGADPSAGPGYEMPNIKPPAAMRTDFHA